jgi:hypothetical protein
MFLLVLYRPTLYPAHTTKILIMLASKIIKTNLDKEFLNPNNVGVKTPSALFIDTSSFNATFLNRCITTIQINSINKKHKNSIINKG